MGGCEQEVFVWGRSQGGGGMWEGMHVYIWRCVRGGSMSIRSTFLPFSVRLNMETGLSSCTYGDTPLCHFHFHRGTVGGGREGGGGKAWEEEEDGEGRLGPRETNYDESMSKKETIA